MVINLEMDMAPGEYVQGKVKWFDPAKGFGFVIADEGGPDILLHANVLRNFGQSSVADGARVEIAVQRTDRGVQATEVLGIVPPLGAEGLPLADFEEIDPEIIANAPLLPARSNGSTRRKALVLRMSSRGPRMSLYMSRC